MSRYSTRILTSADHLRHFADTWDDLWYRSVAAPPTLRAALLAHHLEQFAPRARSWCAVIERADGTAVAALPIVESRRALVACGTMPNNQWSGSGDLLLDESADVDSVCDCLTAAMRHAPWPLFWLEWIPYQSTRWQSLLAAVDRQGGRWETKHSFDVGLVPTAGRWEEYQASWSKNHRRKLKRFEKQLTEIGEVSFEIHDCFNGEEVEQLLREAFEVEDRSWKGEQGTSILQSDGMWDFYLAQAKQLAAWHQLLISLLRVDGRPIASEYGFFAKGVHFACKVGFDGDFQKQSPGNILQARSLERAFGAPAVNAIDFMGPVGQSCESWLPERYAIGKALIAPGRVVGRAMLGAYRHVWPTVKRLRGHDAPAAAAP